MRGRGTKFLLFVLLSIGLWFLYYAIIVNLCGLRDSKADQVADTSLIGRVHGKTRNGIPSVRDYKRLYNLSDFQFMHEPPRCDPTQQIQLLAFVHSAPNHTQLRDTIRETWGTPVRGFRTFFMLGLSANQTAIDEENSQHNDIIQGNFVDAYHNMTYKHVSIFKWVVYNCPKIKFVLKTDDDYYVDIPKLISALPFFPTNNTLFCRLIYHSKVFRHKNYKWSLTLEEYAEAEFPLYCLGPFILYTGDSIHSLYAIAQQTQYLFIDDAFITGILAQKQGIERLGDIPKPSDKVNNVPLDITWPVNMRTFSSSGQVNLNQSLIRKMYSEQYGNIVAGNTIERTIATAAPTKSTLH